MTDQANAGKVYRQDWRGRAATALSFIVSIVVVIGSYVVVDALNVRTPSGKASILPVTRDVVRASVAAVLDERLSDERLKTMLGVDAAASQQADKKNKLATVAKQQGKAVEAPPPGPDYAVSYFKARSGALADELADGIDASAVERLAPCARNDKKKTSCYVPGIRESELRAIREAIEPGVRSAVAVSGSGEPAPSEAVERWADAAAKDGGVQRIWRDGKYAEKPADFLVRALDLATLPEAVARRVATTVNVHTIDADAAAPDARGLVSRLAWGVTAIVFIGLWTAAILMVAWQLWTLPTGFAFGTLGVGVVLAVGVGWATYHYTPGAETFALLGPILQRLEHDAHTAILPLSRVFDAMTTSAIVLLLLAASATTWKATQQTVEDRLEGVRTIFNIAAALLVAQSLQLAVLYTWPAATLEHAQSTTGPLGTAALLRAGLAGAVFSVALMIVYMPAVSVLRAVARENVGPTAETLLQQHGASDSGTQLFLRLLQGLAPLLAAVPMTGLLALLGE